MAFTVTKTKTVFGDKAVVALKVTADAATAAIETGLANISWLSYAPQSMTTASAKLVPNVGQAGTSVAGYLAVSGVASGDVFYVTVYGTR